MKNGKLEFYPAEEVRIRTGIIRIGVKFTLNYERHSIELSCVLLRTGRIIAFMKAAGGTETKEGAWEELPSSGDVSGHGNLQERIKASNLGSN